MVGVWVFANIIPTFLEAELLLGDLLVNYLSEASVVFGNMLGRLVVNTISLTFFVLLGRKCLHFRQIDFSVIDPFLDEGLHF